MRKLFFLIFLISLFLAPRTHAQDDVGGKYSVGKTSCTIEWDSNDRVYKVYWSEGTGYTTLFYKEDLPNGNVVYEEYDDRGTTYSGKFTFKSDYYRSGVYERSDGTEFKVKRK